MRICKRCDGQLPPYDMSRCRAFCQMLDHQAEQGVDYLDRLRGLAQIEAIDRREVAMQDHLVLIRVQIQPYGEVALTAVEAGSNASYLWDRVNDFVNDDEEGTIYRIFDKRVNDFAAASRRVEVAKRAVYR